MKATMNTLNNSSNHLGRLIEARPEDMRMPRVVPDKPCMTGGYTGLVTADAFETVPEDLVNDYTGFTGETHPAGMRRYGPAQHAGVLATTKAESRRLHADGFGRMAGRPATPTHVPRGGESFLAAIFRRGPGQDG